MPVEKLNVALIGLGMVAETHLRAIADLKAELNLAGIFARRPQSLASFADLAEQILDQRPRAYGSVDEIAADPAVDFAIVLTPPNARLEIVAALARAGKHVLMEKPVERDSQAAAQIADICDSAAIMGAVVFQHRMRAASQQLKRQIDAQAYGKLHLVEVAVPWWREQAYYDEPGRGTYERDGGGVLISQAIHTLDLLISLVGDVRQVQAMARRSGLHQMESEDFVSAGLDFDCGAHGSLMASTALYPGDAESITLHFDQAVTHLQSGVLTTRWHDGRVEEFGDTAATGGGADPMAFTHDWHRDVIADFCRAIRAGSQPLVPVNAALQVHRLIDALIESSKSQRAVVLNQKEPA